MDAVARLLSRLYAVKPGTPAITQEIRKFIAGVGRNVPTISAATTVYGVE
jgi:hypothetical protein